MLLHNFNVCVYRSSHIFNILGQFNKLNRNRAAYVCL